MSGSTRTMRPPGTVTRDNSRTAACRSGTCCSTATQKVESKQASANGRRSASAAATFSLMLCADPGLGSVPGVLDLAVDREQRQLRDLQAPEHHFGRPIAAPDVEDAGAGARAERVSEELGKVAVPPPIAQVLERRGREGVHVSRHQGLLVRFASSASKRTRPPRRHGGRAARSIGECAAGLYLSVHGYGGRRRRTRARRAHTCLTA